MGGGGGRGGGYLEYALMPRPAGCLFSGSGASLSGLSGGGGAVGRVGGGSVCVWGGGGGSGLFARVAVEGGVEKAGRGGLAGGGGGDEAIAGVACAPRGCRPVPPDPLHP